MLFAKQYTKSKKTFFSFLLASILGVTAVTSLKSNGFKIVTMQPIYSPGDPVSARSYSNYAPRTVNTVSQSHHNHATMKPIVSAGDRRGHTMTPYAKNPVPKINKVTTLKNRNIQPTQHVATNAPTSIIPNHVVQPKQFVNRYVAKINSNLKSTAPTNSNPSLYQASIPSEGKKILRPAFNPVPIKSYATTGPVTLSVPN